VVSETTSDSANVYDVATGDHVSMPGDPFAWGWTEDGDLFKLGDGTLTTCDSTTGDCTTTDADVPSSGGVRTEPLCPAGKRAKAKAAGDCVPAPDPNEVRLGGVTYES
jgi:hypothetical protein